MATAWTIPDRSKDFSLLPDRLWGLSSFFANGYAELFPGGKAGRSVRLTIYFCLVLRLRMCGYYVRILAGIPASLKNVVFFLSHSSTIPGHYFD